jgi:hypothetical protein
VIHVYDEHGNVIEAREHAGEFNKLAKASLTLCLSKSA